MDVPFYLTVKTGGDAGFNFFGLFPPKITSEEQNKNLF